MKLFLVPRLSIVFAFGLGVLPFAAHAQSTVITSCVSKLTNVSRIVPSAASCNGNTETVVYWNQQGPQGAQGPMGIPERRVPREYRGLRAIPELPVRKVFKA